MLVADFVEPALGRGLAVFLAKEPSLSEGADDVERLMSDCDAAVDVEGLIAPVADCAVPGFDDTGADTGADVTTGSLDELVPLKCDHPK